METLKNLMGDAYKEDMTLEDVDKFLASGKFVDIKKGDYVSKEKYERLDAEHKTLKSEFETYKEQTKDFEKIKADNDKYVAEKQDAELKDKLLKHGIDEKSIAYVKSDINSKVLVLGDDPKVEEANIKQYIKDHPMFAKQVEAPKSKVVVSTKVGNENGGGTQPNQAEKNASINNGLREALGLGEK